MTIEDFNNIAADLRFDFEKDNYFNELKEGEITDNRINLARNMQDMIGKYYSNEWLRKNILKQNDDDIEEQDKEIEEETNSGDPRWINPMIQQNQMSDMEMNGLQSPEDDTNQNPLANDDDVAADPKADEQTRKMQSATATYNLLTKKKNRTLSDEAKLKSATQILAKNK